jgi:hypothetical protein
LIRSLNVGDDRLAAHLGLKMAELHPDVPDVVF